MITGADGYLGRRIARRLLADASDHLLLWVHAKDDAALRLKQEALRDLAGSNPDRVQIVGGDLAQAQPFACADPKSVRRIVHAAAVTRFNVDADTARAVNVSGADKLLQFAQACPSLESCLMLSSVYATGLTPGVLQEKPADGREGFANYYEQSKWQAEQLLQERYAQIPWRILRVATVIADNASGTVSQYNAVHNTLKLFFYGLLSLIPGKPSTPLYLITGEMAEEAAYRVMEKGKDKTIYHASTDRAHAPTLSQFLDSAFEVFLEQPDFAARRILKPLFSDAESFDMLAAGVQAFSGGVVSQAVGSVAPFSRQLFVEKDIRNDRLCELLDCAVFPDMRAVVRRLCAYLAQTKWGKEQHGSSVRPGA